MREERSSYRARRARPVGHIHVLNAHADSAPRHPRTHFHLCATPVRDGVATWRLLRQYVYLGTSKARKRRVPQLPVPQRRTCFHRAQVKHATTRILNAPPHLQAAYVSIRPHTSAYVCMKHATTRILHAPPNLRV
jgi:hypothetical protein